MLRSRVSGQDSPLVPPSAEGEQGSAGQHRDQKHLPGSCSRGTEVDFTDQNAMYVSVWTTNIKI